MVFESSCHLLFMQIPLSVFCMTFTSCGQGFLGALRCQWLGLKPTVILSEATNANGKWHQVRQQSGKDRWLSQSYLHISGVPAAMLHLSTGNDVCKSVQIHALHYSFPQTAALDVQKWDMFDPP